MKKRRHVQQRGRLKLVTAASTTAVTLAETKEYLRVDGNDEDSRITAMLEAAENLVKQNISQSLVNEQYDYFLDAFPCSDANDWWDGEKQMPISEIVGSGNYIDIPWGPNVSVASFVTIDNDDTEYVFDSTAYKVDGSSKNGRLTLALGAVWPATVLRTNSGIRIRFTAGFGAAVSSVPSAIKQAIFETVAAQYEKRGDAFIGIPPAAMTFLLPFQEIKI